MIEALLLALVGGVLGAVIAYVLFNNMTVSTMGQTFHPGGVQLQGHAGARRARSGHLPDHRDGRRAAAGDSRGASACRGGAARRLSARTR